MHSQTSILSNSQRSEESRENWPIQQLAVIWNTCRWKQCRLPVGFNYKSALWALSALSKEFLHFPSKLAQHWLNTACSKLFQPPALIPPSPPAGWYWIFFVSYLCFLHSCIFSSKGGKADRWSGEGIDLPYFNPGSLCWPISREQLFLFIYFKVFHLTCCLLISHLLLGEIKTVYERWM